MHQLASEWQLYIECFQAVQEMMTRTYRCPPPSPAIVCVGSPHRHDVGIEAFKEA